MTGPGGGQWRRAWLAVCGLTSVCIGCTAEPGTPESEESSSGAIEPTDSGDPPGCPTHIKTERVAALAKVSFGYTGFGHGASPVDGMTVSYELYDCDDDCRRCRVRGPVANADDIVVDNRRCRNDYKLACVTDAECGGVPDACQYFWSPPSQTNTSGWSVTFIPPLTPEAMQRFGVSSSDGAHGVINLATGQLDFQVFNAILEGGLGNVELCVGDIAAEDGVKDGHCEGSQLPCDVNASSALATVSFDCAYPPALFAFNLAQHGAGTSGILWELDDSRPFCTQPGLEGERCWCGVCSDQPETSCISDDQCVNGTCGNAGTEELPIITAQNSCAADEVCDWDPVELRGSCLDPTGAPAAGCVPRDGELFVTGSANVQDGYFVSTLGLLACGPQLERPPVFGLDAQFGFPGIIIQRLPYKVTPEYR